jgi:Xaa-Pro aminopeptidase
LDELAAGGGSVAIDPAATPDWIWSRLRSGGAEPVRRTDPCQLPKATKNDIELAGIRAAHRRDGAALTTFLAWLAAEAPGGGVTEISAADHLQTLRARDDMFRGPSFPTISGAGANGAIVHYRVNPMSSRTLENGSLYLVDSGGQYPDGTTDVTRTIAIGEPSPEMRDRFTRVLKGHIAIARARFATGTPGSDLDPLARVPLSEIGLDYDHGTGHGVGCYLNVHEGPGRISKRPNTVALRPGMVISNEPGYYKPGAYGIRIENLVCVVADSGELAFETLTLAPIDRNLIDVSLLETHERDWIDAYHRRVNDEIAPLLDSETTLWLAGATEPLT